MKTIHILEEYAKAISSSFNDWSGDIVLESVKDFTPVNGDILCKRLGRVENILGVTQYSEWDNNCCYLVDVTLNRHISRGVALHLLCHISKVAPVAYTRWLKDEIWTIGNRKIPTGVRFLGKTTLKARNLEKQVQKTLNRCGYFVLPESAFAFEVELGSRRKQKRKTVSGRTFFFG